MLNWVSCMDRCTLINLVLFSRVRVLNKQLTRPQSDRGSVMQASSALSELIAKKLTRHSEEEFMKECFIPAVELLAPDQVQIVPKCEFAWNNT